MERKGELDESQAKEVLDKIEIAATNIYYSGYPSRTTLDLIFPDGISSINNTQIFLPEGRKSVLIFITQRGSREDQLTAVFPFRTNATLTTTSGRKKILIKAEKGDYVNITDMKT